MSGVTSRQKTVVLIVVVAIAAIWGKVRLEAGAALERAQEFERVGYTRLAIIAYRHTVRWYSPGSGPVEVAADRLSTLGAELADQGKADLALEAYRALRSGIYSIRSVYTPYGESLPDLNAKIAALMAAQEVAGGADPASLDARVAHHDALLAKDNAPNVWWSLAATLGFLVWGASLLLMSTRAFDDESGRAIRGPLFRFGLAAALSMALWMTGLALA